jgi:hypothetical protein
VHMLMVQVLPLIFRLGRCQIVDHVPCLFSFLCSVSPDFRHISVASAAQVEREHPFFSLPPLT